LCKWLIEGDIREKQAGFFPPGGKEKKSKNLFHFDSSNNNLLIKTQKGDLRNGSKS
jgi:hypothetical protein